MHFLSHIPKALLAKATMATEILLYISYKT